MKKIFIAFLITIFSSAFALAAEPIAGTWKTIDDETGEAKSLVQIYENNGNVYGRVVRLFKNETATAKGVKGSPKIVGLDILWNLKDTGDKFTGGKILDPKKGKVYNSEAWLENKNTLIVRGKIGPFGRNQKWIREESAKNDIELIPLIPELD
ncbi:MAG: DUF2147 domain-containing protein [Lactobacillaceae bacterium]|jgi:uncharacterized protein (DUF2147 family)|nr:DUF2147 domain-containing protein [Lactobacillaceae bacterium]